VGPSVVPSLKIPQIKWHCDPDPVSTSLLRKRKLCFPKNISATGHGGVCLEPKLLRRQREIGGAQLGSGGRISEILSQKQARCGSACLWT
jgi:hypothetical protein